MTKQDSIIGIHPSDGLYYEWTSCEDTSCTDTKRHRKLLGQDSVRQQAIDQIAIWLVEHHLSDVKEQLLNSKKRILSKYDYAEYADELHILPRTDKTRKGNMGEVLLIEYLNETTGIPILVYKLKYNPNVDQSMKGDDVLLFDTERIIVGESKFRATPSKQMLDSAIKTMKSELSLPISLGFVANILFEQGNVELSTKILEMQIKLGKTSVDIKNVALLLSTPNIGDCVEKHMHSQNQNLVVISLGVSNPTDLMESAFAKANSILLEAD